MKVLIAIDGSDGADYAISWYVQQHRADTEVLLGHISEAPVRPVMTFRAGLVIQQDEWKAMKEEAQRQIKMVEDKYRNILRDHGIKKSRIISQAGLPGRHLCAIAQKEGVSMIVMGTRGLGTVRRTLLGSVSDYVLHHSQIPVAICRYEEPEILSTAL